MIILLFLIDGLLISLSNFLLFLWLNSVQIKQSHMFKRDDNFPDFTCILINVDAPFFFQFNLFLPWYIYTFSLLSFLSELDMLHWMYCIWQSLALLKQRHSVLDDNKITNCLAICSFLLCIKKNLLKSDDVQCYFLLVAYDFKWLLNEYLLFAKWGSLQNKKLELNVSKPTITNQKMHTLRIIYTLLYSCKK